MLVKLSGTLPVNFDERNQKDDMKMKTLGSNALKGEGDSKQGD